MQTRLLVFLGDITKGRNKWFDATKLDYAAMLKRTDQIKENYAVVLAKNRSNSESCLLISRF